jgi:hypothetical protein
MDKSAVAEHSFNSRHNIQIQNTAVLSTKFGNMEHFIVEATDVDLHPINISREEGLMLSRSLRPILRHLGGEKISITLDYHPP